MTTDATTASTPRRSIVVIGAGLAGLAAAAQLRRRWREDGAALATAGGGVVGFYSVTQERGLGSVTFSNFFEHPHEPAPFEVPSCCGRAARARGQRHRALRRARARDRRARACATRVEMCGSARALSMHFSKKTAG